MEEELRQILERFPGLARFRPSCDCCCEIIIERYYGGPEAAKLWSRVVEIQQALGGYHG